VLYIELLGQIRISWGEDRYAIMLNRQSVTLLAHFALGRTHREAREVLIERFWPETDPEKGRSNLSSALSRLRRALEAVDPGIITFDAYGQAGIANPALVWFDANAFRAAVRPALASRGRLNDTAAAELCNGLALYRGELLDGFFDEWVLAEREHLRALYIRGQLRLLDHFSAAEELDDAIECGREVLRLDPLRESVHRRMMVLFAGNGEPAAARRQYDRLVRLLREELGVAPAPETLVVYKSL
jgi:DNA-binding SARP family transcriptional activator